MRGSHAGGTSLSDLPRLWIIVPPLVMSLLAIAFYFAERCESGCLSLCMCTPIYRGCGDSTFMYFVTDLVHIPAFVCYNKIMIQPHLHTPPHPTHTHTYSVILGPSLNQPLNAPKAVNPDWRNDSVYNERLWGTYRYLPVVSTRTLLTWLYYKN